MTEKRDAESPSLEAVRALERQLAGQVTGASALEAALAAAHEQAARIRTDARACGAQAAANRRREVLEESDREAARIRAEGDRRASELRAAMAAALPHTLVVLSSTVLPATAALECSSR